MTALNGKLKHVYLLSGEETFYIDKAREKILAKLKVTPADIVMLDCNDKIPVAEIINAIDTASLFSDKNVVLVKNAPFFSADSKFEHLEDVLQNMSENNFVVFIAKTADKRRKLYKVVAKVGDILEAEPLRAWQIDDWLGDKLKSLGKNMFGDARRYFMERIGVLPEISLWYLDNELNKIALMTSGRDITASILQRALNESPEVSNFALPDAIDARKTKAAVELLRIQSRNFSNVPVTLAVLVNHVRRLLRAKFFMKQGIKGRALSEPLELNPFIAQKIGETAAGYSTKLLEESFLELADADFKLKSGRAGVEILERIVIKLCRRR